MGRKQVDGLNRASEVPARMQREGEVTSVGRVHRARDDHDASHPLRSSGSGGSGGGSGGRHSDEELLALVRRRALGEKESELTNAVPPRTDKAGSVQACNMDHGHRAANGR